MGEAAARTGAEEQMVGNVQKSLENARKVVDHLETSLVRAGFVSGRESYRAMCDVLMGQRLWAATRGHPALTARFRELADRARAVHDILAPYADMMRKLGAADGDR